MEYFTSALQFLTDIVYLSILVGNLKRKEKLKFNSSLMRSILLITAIDLPLDLVKNCIFRSLEFKADEFSVESGYGKHLISGLKRLSETNLEAPVVNSLYSALFYTHPHMFSRISLINDNLNKTQSIN